MKINSKIKFDFQPILALIDIGKISLSFFKQYFPCQVFLDMINLFTNLFYIT